MNKTITVLSAVALGLMALNLFLLIGIVEKKTAHAAKPDSCQQYHEKALQEMKKAENESFSAVRANSFSSQSTAYSLLYQNCRDLERRNP
ncbi:MAG: hypothetical protein HYY86_03070 [Candidatus Harrisonbacteria bacterium]|nr:hypothetical protein [Candidatus Harrisonbacteria bacterium]